MSAERRVELLSWAVRTGAWIIEDKYDAEYRYSGKPIASLHSLDESTIYVGTFTKMLFNALRIGFIVVRERLAQAFRIARSFMDRHAPTFDQAVLTEFIREGHFGRHVRKMRQTDSDRSHILAEEASRRLSGLLDVEHAQSGMCYRGLDQHSCHRNNVNAAGKTAGIGSSSTLFICQQVQAEARTVSGLRRMQCK